MLVEHILSIYVHAPFHCFDLIAHLQIIKPNVFCPLPTGNTELGRVSYTINIFYVINSKILLRFFNMTDLK